MFASGLSQAVFLLAPTIVVLLLVGAFYFDDPNYRPDGDRRWSRRY
jgi:hypothetical protein